MSFFLFFHLSLHYLNSEDLLTWIEKEIPVSWIGEIIFCYSCINFYSLYLWIPDIQFVDFIFLKQLFFGIILKLVFIEKNIRNSSSFRLSEAGMSLLMNSKRIWSECDGFDFVLSRKCF